MYTNQKKLEILSSEDNLPVEDPENPWLQFVLGNPAICDNILDFLSTSDILQISMANKFWRKICRRFLRVKKHLKIYLRNRICSQILKLCSILEFATDLPFVGLHFEIPSTPVFCICKINDIADVEACFPLFFEKLPLQYLSIDYQKVQNNVGEKILQKLLSTTVPKKTEYLHIINWPEELSSFWDDVIEPKREDEVIPAINQSNWLQTLKIFHLDPEFEHSRYYCLVWEIINSAPNLKQIQGHMPRTMLQEVGAGLLNQPWPLPNRFPQIEENKFHLIRRVSMAEPFEVCSVAKAGCSLEYLELHPGIFEPMSCASQSENLKQIIKKSLKTLMENSRLSLQGLNIHFAAQLLPSAINKRIGSLLNLQQLELDLTPSYGNFEDTLLYLKAIDYPTFLPHLSVVRVAFCYRDVDAPQPKIPDRNELLQTAKFTCFSVSTLQIHCVNAVNRFHRRLQMYSALADIFPAVKFFNAMEDGDSPEYWENVGHIWSNNKSLEAVSCFFDMNNSWSCSLQFVTELLENLCCNISPDELERAMDKYDDQHESWNFAPTRLPFCEEFGISRIVVYPCPFKEHVKCDDDYIDMSWKPRFDRISAWIRANMSQFSLQFRFQPCGETCQAVPFEIGPTQEYKVPENAVLLFGHEVARVLPF